MSKFLSRNATAIFGGWFLLSAIAGSFLGWGNVEVLLILVCANVWIAAGTVQTRILQALTAPGRENPSRFKITQGDGNHD